jgi:multidrug efflux pump subunit AcrB
MKIFGRIGTSSFAIFASFVLATILLVLMSLKMPATLEQILNAAGWVEDRITHMGLPTEYNNLVRFFIDDAQLTMIFFVILIRGLLALLGAGLKQVYYWLTD